MPKRRERVGADANLRPTRSRFAARENRGVRCEAVSGTDRLSTAASSIFEIAFSRWMCAATRRCSIAQVAFPFVSELCHISPETPGQHRHLRGHADAHRCCGKSLIASALVGFGVRHHARRESISKRAPSPLGHLSVFRINRLRAACQGLSHTPADFRRFPGGRLHSGFGSAGRRASREIVSDLVMSRDHFQRFRRATCRASPLSSQRCIAAALVVSRTGAIVPSRIGGRPSRR